MTVVVVTLIVAGFVFAVLKRCHVLDDTEHGDRPWWRKPPS